MSISVSGLTVRINNGAPLPCSLSSETDCIDVSTYTPPRLPNPDWTFVDGAGHFHAFDGDGKLPTLRERRIEHSRRSRRIFRQPRSWLNLEWKRRHWYETVLVCDVCGDQISPWWRLGSCHQTVPGLTAWRVRVHEAVQNLGYGVRASLVVDGGSAQYFGFGMITNSLRWGAAPPGLLSDAWTEFTCYPFARRTTGAALPPGAAHRSAPTPPG